VSGRVRGAASQTVRLQLVRRDGGAHAARALRLRVEPTGAFVHVRRLAPGRYRLRATAPAATPAVKRFSVR
jgi:hypothetical protein